MDNLEIYNKFASVPANAQKSIAAGRLKGMTDINPMWRIKALTEVFGVCGVGWKYEITSKEIIDGSEGTKCAMVDINLYVKVDGEWSAPIPGTGGSSFISKERAGLYTSDECYKMALTDAISVACKALGVGADIYWQAGRSKYTASPASAPQPPKEYKCCDCGKPFEPFESKGRKYTAGNAYEMSIKLAAQHGITDGKARCKSCREKIIAEKETGNA